MIRVPIIQGRSMTVGHPGMAVWIEKAPGEFVEGIYLGTYGRGGLTGYLVLHEGWQWLVKRYYLYDPTPIPPVLPAIPVDIEKELLTPGELHNRYAIPNPLGPRKGKRIIW